MDVKSIIKKVLSKNSSLIISLVFTMLFSIAAIISIPVIVKHVIDNIIIENDVNSSRIIFWSVILLIIVTSGFFIEASRNKKSINLGNDVSATLSKEAHSSLLRSELLDVNKIDKDKIYYKVVNDANIIGRDYITRNLVNIIYKAALFLAINITLAIINPWFFLYILAAYPIYYFATKQIDKSIDKRVEIDRKLNEDYKSLLKENIDNVKNIKLLNGITKEEQNFNQIRNDVDTSYRKTKIINLMNSNLVALLIIGILFTMFIGYGSWMILNNRSSTIGDLIAFFLLTPIAFIAFKSTMNSKILSHHYDKEFSELNEIISIKQENRAFTVQSLDEIYSLKFKNVHFNYTREAEFGLRDIDFELKKGEKLGILGLSKSGKTTITDLITKIIRPRQGTISINNCDINRIDTYYLRELISIVPQNFKFINGTILENIIYPYSFDEYKYNDALNKCRLKPTIYALENKEQTNIHDAFKVLDSTSIQKLALANAFYKDARIFVLDEVTSKMDEKSEKEMMDAVYRLKNKVMFIISNRIYNLMKCDKILILNNGRVVEYGKTEKLIEDKKSTFAKMLKESQTG